MLVWDLKLRVPGLAAIMIVHSYVKCETLWPVLYPGFYPGHFMFVLIHLYALGFAVTLSWKDFLSYQNNSKKKLLLGIQVEATYCHVEIIVSKVMSPYKPHSHSLCRAWELLL